MDRSAQNSNAQTFIVIALIAVILILTIPFLGISIYAKMQNINVAGPLEQIRTLDLSILNPFNWYERFYERQYAQATGELMSSQIDADSKNPLGVRAAALRTDSSQYELGEDVVVFTTLNAMSLAQEALDVIISCVSSKGPLGEVIPPSPLTIIGRQTKSVDCLFSDLEVGGHVLTMTIAFEFSTLAYVSVLFSPDQLLRDLVSENKDFFRIHAPNQPRTQIQVTTEGPVNLALGIGGDKGPQMQPVALDIDKPESIYTLAISVDNRWDGYVKEIQALTLLLPKGFSLQSVTGSSGEPQRISCSQLKAGTAKSCDDTLYSVYRVPINAEQIKDFKSYRAYISADNPAQLLGTNPFVPLRFTAIADYSYEFELKKSVTIKAPSLS